MTKGAVIQKNTNYKVSGYIETIRFSTFAHTFLHTFALVSMKSRTCCDELDKHVISMDL